MMRTIGPLYYGMARRSSDKPLAPRFNPGEAFLRTSFATALVRIIHSEARQSG